MNNIFEEAYDGLAAVYEKWCTGDMAYVSCKNFYINYLKNIDGILVELGVGTGRIACTLVEEYHKNIIGIDTSEEMLALASKKISMNHCGGNIRLIKENMLELALPNPVSCIYLPFRTIGHIIHKQDVIRLFERIRMNLKDGGHFLFDHYIFDREWAENHNRVRIKMYEDRVISIEDYYRYDFNKQLMDCSVYVNEKEVARFPFAYRDVSYYEEILRLTGFRIENLYGEYDMSEMANNSRHQIYVCIKDR